jgi:ribosomal protein S14
MTPDKINEKHGRAAWRCNSCGATSGLMWWNGMSVAICRGNDRCSQSEGEKYAAAMAAYAEQAASDAEFFGEAS